MKNIGDSRPCELPSTGPRWHDSRIMSLFFDPYDDAETEIVRLDLPLDRETISWLARLACDDVEAGAIVASMIRSIREDDQEAHRVHRLH